MDDILDIAVYNLFQSVRSGLYPVHEFESIFGIQMPTPLPYLSKPIRLPIGQLVFECWRTLYFVGALDAVVIKRAIQENRLPAWFEENVKAVPSEDRSVFVAQMLQREFNEIRWDVDALARMAQPSPIRLQLN